MPTIKTSITLQSQALGGYVVVKLVNRLTPAIGSQLHEADVKKLINNERDCTVTIVGSKQEQFR